MTQENQEIKLAETSEITPKKKRNPWKTFFKVFGWFTGSLVFIAVCIIVGFALYFTPDRIKKMIEEESSRYINGEVKIGRLDYKILHTYPWLELEIDSVYVISRNLDGLPLSQRELLPAYSDSLASVMKLKAGINIPSLLKNKIQLRNVEIIRPGANIVMVSDSLNNFNILKDDIPKSEEKMDFEMDGFNLAGPIDLKFFSLKDDIEANLSVKNYTYEKEENAKYKVGFDGIANVRYHDYDFRGDLPITFITDISPNLFDLGVAFHNLSFSYAGLKLDLDGYVNARKDGVQLEDFKFNLSVDDWFSFMKYLPESFLGNFKMPDIITGKLPIGISFSQLQPYFINKDTFKEFSIAGLPVFSALIKIEDANLLLSPPEFKQVEADDIYLVMECDFDPHNSQNTSINIQELRINGEGIALQGLARIYNVTGSAQTFNATINFESPVAESLSYIMPSLPVKVSGLLKGDIILSGEAREYGKKGVDNLVVSGNLASGSINVSAGKNETIKLRGVKTSFDAQLPQYPITNYTGTKLDFNFSADTLGGALNGMDMKLRNFTMELNVADTVSGSPDPYGTLLLKANSANITSGGNKFSARNVTFNAEGSLNSNGPATYQSVNPVSGVNDSIIASRVPHTPLVVEYNGGGILQTILGMVDLDAEVKIEKGSFVTPLYLYPLEFSGVDLTTDLTKLKLEAKNIKAANTGFTLSSIIDGVKPFMTSFSATPIAISADINFSNVDINQLSWGYYGNLISKGLSPDSVFYQAPMLPLTASDSICVAIPRNITANIRLFSDQAQCLQYRFAPLSADIILKDGNASISNLTIGTPYCTAVVDWLYSTRSLANIGMDLKARILKFNFADFYPIFPAFIEKVPELKNFNGEINADFNCRFDMFPDMFMNSSSLNGRLNLKGSHLQFDRTGKIDKITHLMLIKGDTPILLENIDLSAAFHDNLLQVNPFKIVFDDYQLSFGGVNNLAGEMYYHLALEKSPFHLPFGVTLKGNMKHPEVRLGGTHINEKEAADIPSNLSDEIKVNIMAYLRHGWNMFIKEAAKYESDRVKDKR